MKKRYNLTKFGGTKRIPKFCQIYEGIPLKQACQNSNFNHLRLADNFFRIGKYQLKIKFDKIWGYENGGSIHTFQPFKLDS